MKTPICLVCALSIAALGTAQETITTSSGEKIILLKDGTWKKSIITPESSTEMTPILKGKAAIHYDPTKWSLEQREEGIETAFKHISGEAEAKIIAERITASPDLLRKVAIKNLKGAAKSVDIISESKRIVNGLEVQVILAKGTMEGIEYKLEYYLYSGKEASIQIITGCVINLFDENKADFEDFMNGITLQE